MKILLGISITFGTLSLLYYILILHYSGIATSFSWVWLLGGIACLMAAAVFGYMIKNEIKITGGLRLCFTLALIIGLAVFISIEGTLLYHSTRKAEPGADYMIILGAQVRGTRLSKALKMRLDAAYPYLKDNPDTIVIVSGGQGQGEDISEAEAMKRYLVEKGISYHRIIKEDRSTSTYENIKFSKELLDLESPSLVIVTNNFHVFRSIGIAKKQGMGKVQGLSAPGDSILTVHYYVREAASVLKDFVFGNL